MEDIRRLWTVLALALLNCTGVVAPSPELVGLAVSGSISFVLLFFVVFMIGVSFSWSSWMRQWMRARGKVRMPKAYFKKKEEMKRRLLSGAASYTSGPGSVANGSLPAQTVDRDGKTTSLVQAWSQRSNVYANNAFEEKDVVLEFGPEPEEEQFQIETVVCDDEVLDVGPFTNNHDNEQVADGDVYSEPYIYSTVDKTSTSFRKSDEVTTTTSTTATTTATIEVNSTSEAGAGAANTEQETQIAIANFKENLVRL